MEPETHLVLPGDPEGLGFNLPSNFLEVGEPPVEMQEFGVFRLRGRWIRLSW